MKYNEAIKLVKKGKHMTRQKWGYMYVFLSTEKKRTIRLMLGSGWIPLKLSVTDINATDWEDFDNRKTPEKTEINSRDLLDEYKEDIENFGFGGYSLDIGDIDNDDLEALFQFFRRRNARKNKSIKNNTKCEECGTHKPVICRKCHEEEVDDSYYRGDADGSDSEYDY